MSEHDLLTIIQQERERSVPDEKIQERLAKQGYSPEDINGAFARLALMASPLHPGRADDLSIPHTRHSVLPLTLLILFTLGLVGYAGYTYSPVLESLSHTVLDAIGDSAVVVSDAPFVPFNPIPTIETATNVVTLGQGTQAPAYVPKPSTPSGGSVSTPTPVTPTPSSPGPQEIPAPAVSVSASASEVAAGAPVTISWNATNASTCRSSSGFSTGNQTSGSASAHPILNTSYTVTCNGTGGTSKASVFVKVSLSGQTNSTPVTSTSPTPATPTTPTPSTPTTPTTPTVPTMPNSPSPTGSWSLAKSGSTWTAPTASSYGKVTFGYARTDEVILKGFPIGHGVPDVENVLYYNLELDGYGGLPPGSCLHRSYFLADNDPTKPICAANENNDLLRAWGSRGKVKLNNILFKNINVHNALRTKTFADGTVVKVPTNVPHVDTFQSYYGDSAPPNMGWMVWQDSTIRNSDTSLMVVGNSPWHGIVYQNLRNGCDAWFTADKQARTANDHTDYHVAPPTPTSACVNQIMANPKIGGTVWLIEISLSGTARVGDNRTTVVVGANKDTLKVDHPACRYRYIEDALADKDAADGCGNYEHPPFIELSCAGWKNPPSGCTTHLGSYAQIALNDTPEPAPTELVAAAVVPAQSWLEVLSGIVSRLLSR